MRSCFLANFLDHCGLVRVHVLVQNVVAMGILLYFTLHFDRFLQCFVRSPATLLDFVRSVAHWGSESGLLRLTRPPRVAT